MVERLITDFDVHGCTSGPSKPFALAANVSIAAGSVGIVGTFSVLDVFEAQFWAACAQTELCAVIARVPNRQNTRTARV